MKIRKNIPLNELTTIRLGGNAKFVIDITSEDDIPLAYKFAREQNLPTYIISGGSNIIAGDEDYNGVILLNRIKGVYIVEKTAQGIQLKIGSGEILDDICGEMSRKGYTGMEALSAIPGTIGGAVIQNSGAYGQDISSVLTSVEVYNTEARNFEAISKSEINYGYRTSIFNTEKKNHYFITAVCLKLKKGEIKGELYKSLQAYLDENKIANRLPITIRQAVSAIRAKKLPDPEYIPSAGSFFYNVTVTPEEKKDFLKKFPDAPIYKISGSWEIASAWLIDQAGLKGKLLHGFRVSETAPLVLIKESADSYADLDAARTEIINTIKDKFGITLQQEPEEIH
ncbi:UDP-N-acetylmuramate dehydrogenase [Ruminococcaceae bacterium OttesenSCG-928-A11]|nr:UDP-N-acetylmuramate dehydrogenase [Ruminococcaceae bacterium OttesenSCG-928-A11]